MNAPRSGCPINLTPEALTAAFVITLGVNVPLDDAIARWTVDTLLSDWASIRIRWEAFHATRTSISLADSDPHWQRAMVT